MTVSASLTVHVYTDANANATQDGWRHRPGGVTVNLLNADGTQRAYRQSPMPVATRVSVG